MEIEEAISPMNKKPGSQTVFILTRLRGLGILLTLGFLLLASFAACNQSGTSANQQSATVVVPPSAQDLQQTVINVINVVQPSVVEVVGQSSQGGSIGSGEILDTSGHIVTNDHVVQGFSTLGVQLSNGKQYPASLVGEDAQDDLAVLRIRATGLRPIHIGNSDRVKVGQFSIAIGSPLGLEQSATIGIVSALDRSASEGSGGPASELVGLIQTSAPINPGNSGGALVDLQGNLVGVPTLAAANPENGAVANGIGFAIASNRVVFVADQLIRYGKLVRSGQGYLGIQGLDVTPEIASAYNLPVQSGVLVAGFSNDASGKSPAHEAGIQTGDIIVNVNGQPIANSGALASSLLALAPGTKVRMTVRRSTAQHTVTVTLGERPTS
jgi:S1-C subfamily serine protease